MPSAIRHENLLRFETSPYLLQHQDNAVHWQPWGQAALDQARTESKPILLSIGYAACHWCHVMARESFEDPAIAGLMNELFVSIKVDREERPDLDQIYQSALALLGQHGGWPLTMFLTPAGEPFWGGTYFPPVAHYGRPGFPEVLTGVAEAYHREPEKISRNVSALRNSLARMAETRGGGVITVSVIDHIAERLLREVDPFQGGIGEAPKFPQCSIFELFWRAWQRTGRKPFRDAVTNTLTRMSQGGIYDHLGGGFARYSTDAEWLAPHFEKMLYDNAQLIDLLTLVWQENRDPLYRTRVQETAAWVLREMVALAELPEGGGFAATLDADSEHEEGKFYVWSEAEIDALLGPDSDVFKRAYDVTPGGNWEGQSILNRRHRPDLGDAGFEAALERSRAVLLAARAQRVRPGWDDKVLADWNGLMIAALANAAQVFEMPSWLAAAKRAFGFCRDRLVLNGRLCHGWRSGQAKHWATLDDFANLSRAALALLEATGDAGYLDQARSWVGVLDRHYWDSERGGYFFTADDAEALIVRTKQAQDNAVPSGNGTMVGVLTRLWHLSGEADYRNRAEAIIGAFSGELGRNFFPLSTLLNNAELLMAAVDVVIVGDPEASDTVALRRAVLDRSMPNRILTMVRPGAVLPGGHPAHGKGLVEGHAAAYLCADMTCSAPLTDPGALAVALGRR
ncbi:MAG: DUF255 domain-containing protein [Azospirillum sp.]|nr:DUF255 domain-containing protein [Azospirillum sp.]